MENEVVEKVQAPEENRKFKEQRLAKEQGKIEAYKVNKFTGEALQDEIDLEIYEAQLKLEGEGKDPSKDLVKILAQQKRERLKAEREKEILKQRTQKDLEEFYKEGNTQEDMEEFLKNMHDSKWQDLFGDGIDKGYISPVRAFKAMKELKVNMSSETTKEINETPPTPNGSKITVKSVNEMNDEETLKQFNAKFMKG